MRVMNRRNFLRAQSAICAGWAITRAVPVLANTPSAVGWRTFEVTTSVELLKPGGVSHIWLPAPLIRDTPYQHTISTRFTAKGGSARLSKRKQNALGIVTATYPAATAKPALALTSRVSLKNYTVDLSSRAIAPPVSQTELDYFLQPSRYVPTDGIVKQTAAQRKSETHLPDTRTASSLTWTDASRVHQPKCCDPPRGSDRLTSRLRLAWISMN
jgi:hypothetical protein